MNISKARFAGKKKIAKDTYEYKFIMDTPKHIDFEAGQYITIIINTKTRRQYSIASSPRHSKNEFDLLVDISPGGIGSQYLGSLKEGDTISFIGGIGRFVLPDSLANITYFICTGSGISPIKSMIETLIEDGKGNIHLIFGSKTAENLIYEDLFSRYLKDGKLNTYTVCLSREKKRKCHSGYVTDLVSNLDNDGQFFLCGSKDMIRSAKELLAKMGVSEESIFFEKFY